MSAVRTLPPVSLLALSASANPLPDATDAPANPATWGSEFPVGRYGRIVDDDDAAPAIRTFVTPDPAGPLADALASTCWPVGAGLAMLGRPFANMSSATPAWAAPPQRSKRASTKRKSNADGKAEEKGDGNEDEDDDDNDDGEDLEETRTEDDAELATKGAEDEYQDWDALVTRTERELSPDDDFSRPAMADAHRQ